MHHKVTFTQWQFPLLCMLKMHIKLQKAWIVSSKLRNSLNEDLIKWRAVLCTIKTDKHYHSSIATQEHLTTKYYGAHSLKMSRQQNQLLGLLDPNIWIIVCYIGIRFYILISEYSSLTSLSLNRNCSSIQDNPSIYYSEFVFWPLVGIWARD